MRRISFFLVRSVPFEGSLNFFTDENAVIADKMEVVDASSLRSKSQTCSDERVLISVVILEKLTPSHGRYARYQY
jgi:hypothetical protein